MAARIDYLLLGAVDEVHPHAEGVSPNRLSHSVMARKDGRAAVDDGKFVVPAGQSSPLLDGLVGIQ